MAEPPLPSPPQPPPQQKWTTLEELLLACAANRYGTSDWDSIAKQLQKRVVSSTSPSPFTPHLCEQKYLDLKRRFVSNGNNINGNSNGDDTGFWLDELRKLRVAELRNELQRYDLSIVSLQMKVKRLKEEREKVKEDERENPDLERESENEKTAVEPETVPDRVTKPETVVVEDSYDGSSNSKKGEGGEAARERVDSVDLRESVAESKGGEGDVNSTTRRSSGKKEKTTVEVVVVSGSSSGDDNQSAATKVVVENGKNVRLVEFLELVRVHKLGSVLSSRFGGQELPRYRNLIRQHIDLGMIQRRLEEGQYSDCYTKFYRDLMLLVNNAIVFFNKKSLEYKSALELRQLVSDHFRSNLNPNKSPPPKTNPSAPTPPKPPKAEPISTTNHIANLKPKLAITGPVIACRKRSSIAGKPAQAGEKKELVGEIPAPTEKTASSFNAVTRKRTRDPSIGSRSSSGKESSGNTRRPSMSPSPAQQPNPNTTPVSAKGDKRKPRPGGSGSSSKVNQSPESGDGLLLDLLKNATVQKNASKGNKRKDNTSRNGSGGKSGKEKGKAEEGKETPLSKSSSRQPKRAATVAATGKRGRDGGKEAETLPKKRQRK